MGIVYSRLGLDEVIVEGVVVQAGGAYETATIWVIRRLCGELEAHSVFLLLAADVPLPLDFRNDLATCAVMYETDKVAGCSPMYLAKEFNR